MSFNWNKEEINVRISRLLDTIVNLANEDNVTTEDEEAIIEAARAKLWSLHDKFGEMIDQNLSIELARSKTKELFEEVIRSVTATAKSDNKITSDELVLIDRIAKFLRKTDFVDLIH